LKVEHKHTKLWHSTCISALCTDLYWFIHRSFHKY